MWPYWLMLLVPVWAVLTPARLPEGQRRVVWYLVGCAFALMIGLRYEVGGDWGNYLPYLERAGRQTFQEATQVGDPGYAVLNWVGANYFGGIYTVNLFCGAVLMLGTMAFCRRQPNPWMGLVAAVPYMLIVVGMGYTRQAVALGFALLGLTALGKGSVRKFVMWVAIGALFHKSAVLLLPIAALAASRNRVFSALLVGASTVLMYYLLLADSSEVMWNNYVTANYQSQGGLIRVIMNVVPGLLLVMYSKRLVPDPTERKLWLWMAAFSFVCLPLVVLASTAVDRVALYLIPLQLFVFSRLPRLAHTVRNRTPLVLGIVGYYTAVQFVWLNFGIHARGWLPYQFMPLW